jgi:RHS repeat-associated protein
MMMPGRKYDNGSGYRYGFNGKEKDNDVKGEGNQQDYGMRVYDPRLGKFLSVDPITNEYPELTPYQFASNTPIWAIDLDGLEKYVASMQCFAPYEVFGANSIEEPGIPAILPGLPSIPPTFIYYKGDGASRKFGDGGTYRTSGSVTVDLSGATSATAKSGTTTSIKYANGVAVKTDKSPSHIEYDRQPELQKTSAGEIVSKCTFHCYGSNQVSTVGQFIDIDNHLAFNITKNSEGTKLNIKGLGYGDRFPCGEAFVQDEAGNKLVLGGSGHQGPDENWGPFLNLPGDNLRFMFRFNIDVNINSKGEFQSIDFKDKNGKVTNYSIADWNAMFLKLDPKNMKVGTNVWSGDGMNFYDKDHENFHPGL